MLLIVILCLFVFLVFKCGELIEKRKIEREELLKEQERIYEESHGWDNNCARRAEEEEDERDN